MNQSELKLASHYLDALKSLFKLVGERGDNWISINKIFNNITKRKKDNKPIPTLSAYWWYKNLKRGEKKKLGEVLDISPQMVSNIFSCKQGMSAHKEEMIKLKILAYYKESLDFETTTHAAV